MKAIVERKLIAAAEADYLGEKDDIVVVPDDVTAEQCQQAQIAADGCNATLAEALGGLSVMAWSRPTRQGPSKVTVDIVHEALGGEQRRVYEVYHGDDGLAVIKVVEAVVVGVESGLGLPSEWAVAEAVGCETLMGFEPR